MSAFLIGDAGYAMTDDPVILQLRSAVLGVPGNVETAVAFQGDNLGQLQQQGAA